MIQLIPDGTHAAGIVDMACITAPAAVITIRTLARAYRNSLPGNDYRYVG